MSTTFQSYFTWLIGVVLAMMALLFGLSVYSTNNQQMAMNNAVELMLTNSRDDDARVERGVYVVNRKKFENYLEKSNFDNWYKARGRGTSKYGYGNVHAAYKFDIDTSPRAQAYMRVRSPEEVKEDCVPIKAVKVVVLGKSKLSGGKQMSKSGNEIMAAATFVVSSNVHTRADDITDPGSGKNVNRDGNF